MKRERPARETTRLAWEPVLEELTCAKCRAILHWNFGFKRCPYCKRKIVSVDERRARTQPRSNRSVIIR